MPPPLAPWLYPHHDDVLKGIQAFSSIREARNAADRLRIMRDQMDALATYRRSLINQKAQQFRQAAEKLQQRNELLGEQNRLKGQAIEAINRRAEMTGDFNTWKTQEANDLARDLTQKKIDSFDKRTEAMYGATKAGGGPKLEVQDVPGSSTLAVGYNANNPKANFHWFDKRTGQTREPTAAQMLSTGAELSKSIDSDLNSIGRDLVKRGAVASGITNAPAPAVNSEPIKAPSLWQSIKQRIAGSPPPLTVNPGASLPGSGATLPAAPAVPVFEPPPLDPKQRVKGKTYMGKAGPGVWTGTGFAPVSAPAASIDTTPITTADLPVQLRDVPRDGLLGLPPIDTTPVTRADLPVQLGDVPRDGLLGAPTFDPSDEDDIDELLNQFDMGDEGEE